MIVQMCGPLGFETAEKLYEADKEKAKARFAGFFIKQFLDTGKKEAAPPSLSIPVGQGGLFGALWELGESLKCGLEVNLADIPVPQEVVEILELYDESPYECSSEGAYVLAADELIPGCTAIGKTTRTKARIINDGEAKRFLTPPARQEKDIQNRKGLD